MFLPIGDTPNPPGTPYVNYGLIGVNVAVFLLISLPLMYAAPDLQDPALRDYLHAFGVHGRVPVDAILRQVSAYDLVVYKYGYKPGDPSLVSLFTSLFLHGGWMHIIGNMLFLWIFGDNVEHRLGHGRYLIAYLGTGVFASLFFGFFVPGSHVPLVGASGAISGVLGFYFLWFPRNKVKVFLFLFPFIITTLMIPCRWVLGFFLLIDNLLPFILTGGAGSGVAHGAHIGGFLAGAALAWGGDRWRELRGRQRLRSVRREEETATAAIGDPLKRLQLAVAGGELRKAATLYFNLDGREQRRTVSSADLLQIGHYLLGARHWDEALSVFRRFIAERPDDALLDQAFLGAGKALLHKPRCTTSAYHYLLSALDVARTPELTAEVRQYLRTLEQLDREAT